MLANTEHERVVEGKIGTLRLCHIEVVPLSMRCRMKCQERVWRITARMYHGQAKGQLMRVELVGVLGRISSYSRNEEDQNLP